MPRSTAKRTDVEDRGLWRSELGRYLREGAEGAPSIEEVREVLAAVTKPLARWVEGEREASER